jgi:hypothetical protein
MKMKPLVRIFLFTCAAIALAACSNQGSKSSAAASAQSQLDAARSQLVSDLDQCTNSFGYDPQKTADILENQLAPRELEWRQCGYDAVRKYAQFQPALTGRYEQLINEDISMTNAIQSGAMTRTQRRNRLEALIDQIKTAEEEQIQAGSTQQEEEKEQVRRTIDSMRGFYSMTPPRI